MKRVTLIFPFDIKEEETKLCLAMKPFVERKISLGQASALAGYFRKAFTEILGKHKNPVFDYLAEELKENLENA